MDAVYPLHTPIVYWGKEIEYSIKLLKKFTAIDKIFTVGDSHELALHIPYTQTQAPSVNIWEKCIQAAKDDRVSDPFLFICDDHYFIKPSELYPNYCHGMLKEYPFEKFSPTHPYAALVAKTLKYLGDCIFYNVHCPVVVHKEKLFECFREHEDELYRGLGLLFKTTYLYNEQPGPLMDDYKSKPGQTFDELKFQLRDRHIFSSSDEYCRGVEEYLEYCLHL